MSCSLSGSLPAMAFNSFDSRTLRALWIFVFCRSDFLSLRVVRDLAFTSRHDKPSDDDRKTTTSCWRTVEDNFHSLASLSGVFLLQSCQSWIVAWWKHHKSTPSSSSQLLCYKWKMRKIKLTFIAVSESRKIYHHSAHTMGRMECLNAIWIMATQECSEHLSKSKN